MTVDETLRNQADYLDALAAAIRTVNGRLDALTRTDLEARLGVGGALNDSMGGAPGALFGQSAPAATLGNVQPFVGQQNVLQDPEIVNLPFTNLTTVRTGAGDTRHFDYAGASWRVWYTLNSGTAPSTIQVYRNYGRDDITDNPFNSSTAEIHVTGMPAGAFDITVYIEGGDLYNPVNIPVLPYMVGALRVAQVSGNSLTNVTTAAVSLQLVQDPGGAFETLLFESPIDDWRTRAYATQRALVAGAVVVNPLTHQFVFRLKVRIAGSGSGGNINVDFGEPQLHFSYTPDPVPYSPVVSAWRPTQVGAIDSTFAGSLTNAVRAWRASDGAGPRLRAGILATGEGFLDFGPGGTALDARLYRSAAKVLTIDDDAAGPVTTKHVGPLFIQGPDSMDLAVTYGAFGPTLVTRTDGALISTTTITYTGAGLIASVVTTQFAKTFTVTPVYTGANITSVHRAVA